MPVTSYISVGGRMISEITDGVILDYVPDALGSIHSVIDQDANVVKTMRYKPYGEVLSRSGTVADRHYQWVGSYGYRATFAPSSSHYVRARHYSATAGSWTTVDPLWPQESAYGYVRGRASSDLDFFGLQGSIGVLPTCSCSPKPRITGLYPKREGSRLNCYLRACAEYCRSLPKTDPVTAGIERCGTVGNAIKENSKLPPCTYKDGKAFETCGQNVNPGSPPGNASNFPLPEPQCFPIFFDGTYGRPMPPICMIGDVMCGIECHMRVCCAEQKKLDKSRDEMLIKWLKCDGRR